MKSRILLIFIPIFLLVFYYYIIPPETKFFLSGKTRKVINEMPYFIDNWGWKYRLRDSHEGQSSISFGKDENDTLKHLVILLNEEDEAIQVYTFSKDFMQGGKMYHIVMKGADTLYYLSENRKSHERTFYNGGYFYKYTFLELSSDERPYFLLYKDSLSRIKGNYLPHLPKLTDLEVKKFDEKFN